MQRTLTRHLPRWIKASVLKFFQQLVDKDGGLHLKFEGTPYIDQEGRVVTKLPQWAEFRLDGPFSKEPSNNYWTHRIEVNLLVATNLSTQDFYSHERSVGIIYDAFRTEIPVFRLGNGEFDNQAQLGCFQIQTEEREAIIVSNFGQIETDIKLTQSTVEGHYRMDLKTE